MNEDQKSKSISIIKDLISRHSSMREFSRQIKEDATDVCRWTKGKKKIMPRAIISICKLYPEIKPHDLNPDLFPIDTRIVTGK